MISRSFCSPLTITVILAGAFLASCKDKTPDGMEAGAIVATPAVVEAGAAAPIGDVSQCAGCQLTAQQSWMFQGIYRDDACTDPLVQQAPPACAAVPAIGAASVTYVEEVGGRKAGEVANVTLTEQIAPAAARYRKSGTKCVRADESAVDLTPAGCAGQKVCRDATGTLACANCRTFANGCPDLEETRIYAAVNDPQIKKTATAGGGGNLARLRQCCAALAAEAKRLGASPEAGMLNSAAAQCNTLVTAAGPSGNAPELGAIRTVLAGRNVPAICAGF